MIFRLFIPLFLVFFIFLYVALLNPEDMSFFYGPGASVQVPFIVVVMLSFLSGVLSLSVLYMFKGLGDAVSDFSSLVARWRAARFEAQLWKARKRAGEGKLKKSFDMVEKMLEKKPEHFHSQILKGDILRKLGRPEDALRAHSVALSVRPADIEAIRAIKEDYKACGRPRAAYRMLEQLRARAPHDIGLLDEMRDVSVQLGELHRAAALQKEIVSMAPDGTSHTAERVRMAEIHCLYGEQLMAEGHYEQAREVFELALKVEPGFEAGAVLLGGVLVRLGRHADAEAILKKAFQDSRSPALALKIAQLSRGEEDRVFEWAEGMAPGEPAIKLFLILEKIRKGDYRGASVFLSRWSGLLSPLSAYASAKEMADTALSAPPGASPSAPQPDALAGLARAIERFQCQACDAIETDYFPQCTACGQWNTASVVPEAGVATTPRT